MGLLRWPCAEVRACVSTAAAVVVVAWVTMGVVAGGLICEDLLAALVAGGR